MNLVRFAARLVCVASAARGGGAETAETRGGVEHCEPWAFVHTPKAGGSTIIQKALQPRAKYATTYAVPAKFHHYMRDYFHVPAREQRNACEATPGCDWGDVNSFAVVRNPYDLTVSRFFYLAERCAKLGIEGLVCNYGGIVGKPDRNASHKCAFNARGPAGKIATCRGRVRGPRAGGSWRRLGDVWHRRRERLVTQVAAGGGSDARRRFRRPFRLLPHDYLQALRFVAHNLRQQHLDADRLSRRRGRTDAADQGRRTPRGSRRVLSRRGYTVDESRRRRGCDADIPWRRVAATSRVGRENC